MRTVPEKPSLASAKQRWAGLASWLVRLALPLTGLAAFGLSSDTYYVGLANLVWIAAIGATSQGLLLGWAGQVSLGFAAFFAVGGMCVTLLWLHLGINELILGLPAAFLAGGIAGVVVGAPAARMKGLYLAVSSLAFHFVLIYLIGQYQHSVGASEVLSVPSASLAGAWTIRGTRAWYFVLMVCVLLAVIGVGNLGRSRFGRAWKTIHFRETVAAAFGVRPYWFKLLAFAVSSGLAAVGGALDAYYNGFIAQDRYSIILTIETLAMIILGGMSSITGWLIGAACITLLPFGIEHIVQAVAPEGRLQSYIFQLQQAVFGLILLIVLVVEPAGLVGVWGRAIGLVSRLANRRMPGKVWMHGRQLR